MKNDRKIHGKERENIAWFTWICPVYCLYWPCSFTKNKNKSITCRGHKNGQINTLQSLTTCTFYSHSFSVLFYSNRQHLEWIIHVLKQTLLNTSSVEHVNEIKCLIKLHLVALIVLPHFQNLPDLLAAWM